MSSSDHDAAVSLAEIHIHYAVEQPCWTCWADEVRRMTLLYACQRLRTTCTFQQPWPGNELAKFAAHHPHSWTLLPLLSFTPLCSILAPSSCNCNATTTQITLEKVMPIQTSADKTMFTYTTAPSVKEVCKHVNDYKWSQWWRAIRKKKMTALQFSTFLSNVWTVQTQAA